MPPQAGRDVRSIKRALVLGAAFPLSLQAETTARGIVAYQAFGIIEKRFMIFVIMLERAFWQAHEIR